MSTDVCPKNYLAQSILVTIFCCLPFGIVGIVYAAKVAGLFAAGNFEAAEAASRNAKKWMKLGFIIGLIVNVLTIIMYVAQGIGIMSAM